MQKQSTQNELTTKLQIDFLNKRGILYLSGNITPNSEFEKVEHKQTVLKLKCKPSLQNLILHDFKQSFLKQKYQQMNEIITLKVTQIGYFSVSNENKNEINIQKIECNGQNHTIYILSLIRSIWQQKIKSQNKLLKFQNIIEACQLYISQFQLNIDDLIEIFQAPLTAQYSRL